MKGNHKWHKYFFELAYVTAKMSKSNRLKVGAVLVKDNRVIACGYNGLPKGYEPDVLEDENNVTKPQVIHAEVNAVLSCAEHGISCKGATLYVTHSPCESCAALIIQAGITQIYYMEEYRISSFDTFSRCNVDVTQFKK
jgi:dCMP deaminase